MFRDILPNVSRHSPEHLATFPRMFEDISRNMAFPNPIHCVSRIPFPVPVFLVFYIAYLLLIIFVQLIDALTKVYFEYFSLRIRSRVSTVLKTRNRSV